MYDCRPKPCVSRITAVQLASWQTQKPSRTIGDSRTWVKAAVRQGGSAIRGTVGNRERTVRVAWSEVLEGS